MLVIDIEKSNFDEFHNYIGDEEGEEMIEFIYRGKIVSSLSWLSLIKVYEVYVESKKCGSSWFMFYHELIDKMLEVNK